MARFTLVDQDLWGHRILSARPEDLIERLADEVRKGIDEFEIIAIEHQPCDTAAGYERVNVELRVSKDLFDLFMNGNAGYRAQCAQGVQQGEAYNRAVLDATMDMLVQSERLFAPKVDAELCRRSLEGRYTKFWFPKFLTDPSAQQQILSLPEVITWPPWVDFWLAESTPRRGLLAPLPDEPAILLNGSFVRRGDWATFEQKPGRSEQLTREGWT